MLLNRYGSWQERASAKECQWVKTESKWKLETNLFALNPTHRIKCILFCLFVCVCFSSFILCFRNGLSPS